MSRRTFNVALLVSAALVAAVPAGATIDYDYWDAYVQVSEQYNLRQYAWVSFSYSEYSKTWGEEITWDDAAADVKLRFGDDWELASFTSQAEQDWVTSWVDTIVRDGSGNFDPIKVNRIDEWDTVSIVAWLGGYQPTDTTLSDPSQGWSWSSGEAWDYTRWGPSSQPFNPDSTDPIEPNNLSPFGPQPETVNWENALQLNYYGVPEGYYWNDIGGRDPGVAGDDLYPDYGWLPYGYIAQSNQVPGLPAFALIGGAAALGALIKRKRGTTK